MVGSSDFPVIWAFSHSLAAQLVLVVAVPGLLALVFGWLAFRSRVTGVYLSILTQAMTLALALYLFQNDSGLRGNNGLSGLQNLPGLDHVSQDLVSMWFFWASALALGLGYLFAAWVISGKFGSVLRGIRDNEARVRFLGYSVEGYKLFIFTVTAMIAGIAGALYYPQAGIINPAEVAPIASIYLAVWVAIGGRGRLYGAVIGAVFVSLVSTWFTGGQAPDINLGFYTAPVGRLVDDPARPQLRRRHPVRAQGHRRAVRSLHRAGARPTATAPISAPTRARFVRRRPANEHASRGLRRLGLLRRVQGDQQPQLSRSATRKCAPSSAPTGRARPPSWTSSPARPGPTRAG